MTVTAQEICRRRWFSRLIWFSFVLAYSTTYGNEYDNRHEAYGRHAADKYCQACAEKSALRGSLESSHPRTLRVGVLDSEEMKDILNISHSSCMYILVQGVDPFSTIMASFWIEY